MGFCSFSLTLCYLFLFLFLISKKNENKIINTEEQEKKNYRNAVVNMNDTEEEEMNNKPLNKEDYLINNIIQIDNNEEIDLLDTSIESDNSDMSLVDIDNKISLDVGKKVHIDKNKNSLAHILVELKKIIDKISQCKEPLLDTFSDLPEMGDYALLSKIVKIEI